MNRTLLEKVCHTPGIPGYEDDIQDLILEILEGSCDEVWRDRVGNVIGLKRATNPPEGQRSAPRRSGGARR